MKKLLLFMFVLYAVVGVIGEEKQPSCLIVKHKGTLGRRLMFGALIGVPIAPGAKFDLVEAIHYPAAKMAYHGRELESAQASGVHVIVLETHYSAADLENARKTCATLP